MSKTRRRPRQFPGVLLLAVIAFGCTQFGAGGYPRLAPALLDRETPPVHREGADREGSPREVADRKAPLREVADYEIRGRARPVPPDQQVVVALRPASGEVGAANGQATLEQRQGGLSPRFLVVPVGHVVAFVNRDSVCHGYFSVSEVDPFELPVLKPSERTIRTMRKPGIVHVHCRLGGGRRATILVVPSRHFAVASPNGEFAIGGLRPGRWLLEAWTGDTRHGPLEVESQPSGAAPLLVSLPAGGGGSL